MSNQSRRDFLKSAAIVAGAAVTAPLFNPTRGLGAEPATSAAPVEKLNIALIGCGGQGRYDIGNAISAGANVTALCDVDEKMIGLAKKEHQELADAKTYGDYRKLLDGEKSLDGVVIATPDHWHAPICRAFMLAGKHVYCEKPLTHSVGEARELRELSKNCKVATQMGNHGSASPLMRRSVELIRAGVLGQVQEIHAYLRAGRMTRGQDRPAGADPVPPELNWDFWLGPAPARPFKLKTYHPYDWRGWYDFGSGQFGDFGCHCLNLPLHALDLTYPRRIEVDGVGFGKESTIVRGTATLHFPARGKLDPLVIYWYDAGATPGADIMKDVIENFKGKMPIEGVLLIGEKGIIWTNPWNMDAIIKLNGEPHFRDVVHHEATRDVPRTLPRVKSHAAEWLAACQGGPPALSNFEAGGHLTEIVLSGVVAQRLGHNIDWDGEKMQVIGVPEADAIIHPRYRKDWTL